MLEGLKNLASRVEFDFGNGSTYRYKAKDKIAMSELYMLSGNKVYELKNTGFTRAPQFVEASGKQAEKIRGFFKEAIEAERSPETSKKSEHKCYTVKGTREKPLLSVEDMNQALKRNQDLKTHLKQLKTDFETEDEYESSFKSFLEFFKLQETKPKAQAK